MSNTKIAVIGTGNLGLSIVKGLLNKIDGRLINATDSNIKQIGFLI
jgi:pyrroline-5-carboxylate reductase